MKKAIKKITLKKISKKTYSEFLQECLDTYDEKEIEELFVKAFTSTPPMVQKLYKAFLKSFMQTTLLHYTNSDNNGIGEVLTKEVFDQCLKGFVKRNNHTKLVNGKYEETFFALSYGLIGQALNLREVRKRFGLKKGFFG